MFAVIIVENTGGTDVGWYFGVSDNTIQGRINAGIRLTNLAQDLFGRWLAILVKWTSELWYWWTAIDKYQGIKNYGNDPTQLLDISSYHDGTYAVVELGVTNPPQACEV